MCCGGDTAAFISQFPLLVCKIAPKLCKFTEREGRHNDSDSVAV